MIKALRFAESTSSNYSIHSHVNSYIRQTMKPYACSIVPIERFNESIHITKDLMYPCFAQKTIDIQSKSKDAMYPLDETQ